MLGAMLAGEKGSSIYRALALIQDDSNPPFKQVWFGRSKARLKRQSSAYNGLHLENVDDIH